MLLLLVLGGCRAGREPVIGISSCWNGGRVSLDDAYPAAVRAAGGVPMILPPVHSAEEASRALAGVDALILSGGEDVAPARYGEAVLNPTVEVNAPRDTSDFLLAAEALQREMPILGICRGCQVLAAALGGSLWQDIPSPTLKHSQELDRSYASHTVSISEGSLLHDIFATDTIAVNSFHHQAVRDAGPQLRIVATAADGVTEAIESSQHKSIIGVQWHPECFCLRGDKSMQPLFRWLTAQAQSYADARRLHSRTLTLDSHCDTPMFFDQDIHFERRDPRILMDLHKMHEGRLDACIMVAYLPQGELNAEGYAHARQYADDRLCRVRQLAADNAHSLAIAHTPADLHRLKAEGRHAIMLAIENGYAIGRDIQLLDHFAEQGIVYITLCHNGNNDICGSARPRQGESLCGITDFGRQVISRMNELGIMVDLSHASEQSFYDALDISTVPIVCSHSSSRTLCDHPRNLTDEQLRALARRGGVAQATFYSGFLRTDGQATIIDAVSHIRHMVDVAGIEHVGIGSDFDGDGGVPGLASAAEMINLTRRLLSEQFSPADLRLLWGENFLRVMTQAQQARTH